MGCEETAPDTAGVLLPTVLGTDLETGFKAVGDGDLKESGYWIYEKAIQTVPKSGWRHSRVY